jgi:diguanylate cyclase (GGDEF)-like protein
LFTRRHGAPQPVMLTNLSPTEVAFLLVAVVQAVAAAVWALGAAFIRAERTAMMHWAGYAGLSAVTWLLLSLLYRSPPVTLVLVGVCAALLLRRGIRIFVGRPSGWQQPTLALALVLAGGVLAETPGSRPLQAVLNFGVLSWLYLGMAIDLWRHARDELRWPMPWLLSVPLLLGAAVYGGRGLRALFRPESVLAEMNAHSALNVGSALVFVVLVLLLHATLMTLVVSRLVNQLQRLARRDGLTGLLNRRALLAALDDLVRQRRRAGDAFSLLMIDVDRFKDINDRHGHEAGDRALAHIARLMTQTLPADALIGRFGGEEFVVLLPSADCTRALADAERLRVAVMCTPLEHASGPLAPTLSIGVAQSAGPAEDPARLLARADAALYQAKRDGRNRVQAAAAAADQQPRLQPL